MAIIGLALDSFLVMILCFELRLPTELQESQILSSVTFRRWVTGDLERPIVYLSIILKTAQFVCLQFKIILGEGLIRAQFTTDGIDLTRFHFNAWEGGVGRPT